METTRFIDTHVLLWLYGGNLELISNKAKEQIRASDHLKVSPLSILEADYLHELERIDIEGSDLIKFIDKSIHLKIADDSYSEVVNKARNIKWTHDAFDRLIVAQAALHKAVLITRDRKILENYTKAIW